MKNLFSTKQLRVVLAVFAIAVFAANVSFAQELTKANIEAAIHGMATSAG
jgi:hypothetical protein